MDRRLRPYINREESWIKSAYKRLRDTLGCKICLAIPNIYGEVEHGRGCYQYSEYGGGYSDIDIDDMVRVLGSIKPTDEIELTPAAQWVCIKCGCLNFVSLVPAELTPEDRENMDIEGDWLMSPEIVSCSKCESAYTTKDYNDV